MLCKVYRNEKYQLEIFIDRFSSISDEIHLKENSEIELKRTISDLELKCSSFQAQHDALVNEKNSFQRNLQSSEEESLKLKNQISSFQLNINELKDKIAYRDGEISRLQLQIDKMERERRMLKNRLRSSQLAQQQARAELNEKRKENDRKSKILQVSLIC